MSALFDLPTQPVQAFWRGWEGWEYARPEDVPSSYAPALAAYYRTGWRAAQRTEGIVSLAREQGLLPSNASSY